MYNNCIHVHVTRGESPPVVSCDYSTAYDTNHLLSGGTNFSVRLWDLYKGILFHTIAVHGGWSVAL
uniref:Uncharacterized protein n=1 Tax=Amphimedon queenslandica TaxID=400682 RepID=A0A1X7STL6_AMPQE